jgi:hypothetical protein
MRLKLSIMPRHKLPTIHLVEGFTDGRPEVSGSDDHQINRG